MSNVNNSGTEGHWAAPRGGYTSDEPTPCQVGFWSRLVARLFRRT